MSRLVRGMSAIYFGCITFGPRIQYISTVFMSEVLIRCVSKLFRLYRRYSWCTMPVVVLTFLTKTVFTVIWRLKAFRIFTMKQHTYYILW